MAGDPDNTSVPASSSSGGEDEKGLDDADAGTDADATIGGGEAANGFTEAGTSAGAGLVEVADAANLRLMLAVSVVEALPVL